MRLRDVAIGLQAELTEVNYQMEKVELASSELRNEIQDLGDRLRISEVAHRASRIAATCRKVIARCLHPGCRN
jgi:phage shock protein A